MKPLGIVASDSWTATSLLQREFIDQCRSRFGVAPPLPLVVNAQHGHGMEMAVRRRDVRELIRLTTIAARQCFAAGAEAVIFGSSVMCVADAAITTAPVVIDLIDAAFDAAVQFDSVSVVGLIGPRLEDEESCWQTKADQRGLGVRLPSVAGRRDIEAIMRRGLGDDVARERARMNVAHVAQQLQQKGAEVVISTVSELKSVLRPHDIALPVIHAAEYQVAKAISWSTGVPSATGR